MKNISERFHNNPLPYLIAIGLFVRVIAALFSKGFLTLDDHHNFVIDSDLIASGGSLSHNYKDSALYPGIGAAIMILGRSVGISSPDSEMFIIRLTHALLSIFVIYFTYKILELTTNKTSQILGGIITATFFIIPVTAVHQFEESFCQIPLLASLWFFLLAQKAENKYHWYGLLSGVMLGLAVIIRLQLLTYALPFSLGILLFPSLRKLTVSFYSGLILVLLLQSVSNYFINNYFAYTFIVNFGLYPGIPFEKLHIGNYPAGPPWRYVLTLLGFFIPPFSILFIVAAFRGCKYLPLASLSTLVFFIAHSLIPNKQERFILPIIPLLIIFAAAGFPHLRNWFKTKFLAKLYRIHWRYFWILNSLFLILAIFHYGKKDRVEPLVYLNQKGDIKGIVICQYNHTFLVPDYYLGKPAPPYFVFTNKNDFYKDVQKIKEVPINYIILYTDSLENDQALIRKEFPSGVKLEKIVTPSLGDWLAHIANPRFNKTGTAYIFSL